MSDSRTWTSAVACPGCRKRSYPSRKTARAARRALYPGEHLTVYRCRTGGTGYHIGHVDAALRDRFARDRARRAARESA